MPSAVGHEDDLSEKNNENSRRRRRRSRGTKRSSRSEEKERSIREKFELGMKLLVCHGRSDFASCIVRNTRGEAS